MIDIRTVIGAINERPGRKVLSFAETEEDYILAIFIEERGEEAYFDPWFSVNKTTGDIREYDLYLQENFKEILEDMKVVDYGT